MELASVQAEKPKKKTLAARTQKIEELEKKIASLEKKDKEYQRMKNETLVLQGVVEEQQSAVMGSSKK
jgi:hypothetical protein